MEVARVVAQVDRGDGAGWDEWQKKVEWRCNIHGIAAYFYTKSVVRFWRDGIVGAGIVFSILAGITSTIDLSLMCSRKKRDCSQSRFFLSFSSM